MKEILSQDIENVDKKKNRIEVVFSQIDEIVLKMKEKGLEKDAEIAEKAKERIRKYIEYLKKTYENKKNNPNVIPTLYPADKHLSEDGKYRLSVFNRNIPVTHEVGKGDGNLFTNQEGIILDSFYHNNLEKDELDKIKKDWNLEFINYSFSEQGEKEFFESLGISLEDEKDDPEKLVSVNISPTNIKGLFLKTIKEKKTGSYGNKLGNTTNSIYFQFDDNFIDEILDQD